MGRSRNLQRVVTTSIISTLYTWLWGREMGPNPPTFAGLLDRNHNHASLRALLYHERANRLAGSSPNIEKSGKETALRLELTKLC